MAGNVRADQFLDGTGSYGIKINSTSGRSNFYYLGWEFEEEGGCLTPVGRNQTIFYATGADQTYTVPATSSYIYVKMWGAGGGNGRAGGWSYGADGGGGGHTRGLVPVTGGTALTVKVGVGGNTATVGSSYGGGGGTNGSSDVTYAGQGGGGTYLFNGSTPLLIAGGGGGGGSSRAWFGNVGGAGGGINGQRGESPYDGKANYAGGGGTQSAGGASVGTAGSLYQGGVTNTNSYGGGGGGGYYGGGGGGYSESNTMAGGGGGSGFVATNVKLGGTFAGDYRLPGFFWDNDLVKNSHASSYLYAATYAHGAQNLQNNIGAGVQTGGSGIVVIYY
jgi:hypothetical protein